MRELHFDVAGQLLRRNKQCDFENIVRGSDNYLCLVFHFDNDWKETKRVISFYDVDGKQTNGTQEQEEVARDYYNQLEAELLRVANEQKAEIKI